MSNGVDFKALAVDLRKQLDASDASKIELLDALKEALDQMQFDLVKIDAEWGTSRTLKEIIEEDPSSTEVMLILKARAAIAKAEGEQL